MACNILGSWYCELKYAFKVYQMNVLKIKSMILLGEVHEN